MAPCFVVFAKVGQWLNCERTELLDACGHPVAEAEGKFCLLLEKENLLCA
jgi:hypothetical protein